MDLRWLEDAIVLLEEGNMSRAARRRNVTQPAFSRRIRALERWLGTPLLERGSNRVELRPTLLDNEDEIRSVLVRVLELRGRIHDRAAARAGLSIATQHALMFSAVPDMLCANRRLSLRLRAGNRGACLSMFVRGEAQALLCYEDARMAQMPFDDSVQRHRWGSDRLIPVVASSLLEAGGGESAALSLPAIVYPRDSYFGALLSLERKPGATVGDSEDTVCESAFSAGIKTLVLAELGLAWLPSSLVKAELESGRLSALDGRFGSVTLEIALYVRARDAASGALKELLSREDASPA